MSPLNGHAQIIPDVTKTIKTFLENGVTEHGTLPQNCATSVNAIGPLIGDGAEYSALEIVESKFSEELYGDTSTVRDLIPASL